MATQFATKALLALTPPPFQNPDEYDGWQLRWRFLVFRPAYFRTEVVLAAAVLFYVACVFFGKSVNRAKASRWVDAHLPLYQSQFSNPQPKGLVADGYSDFFTFSTGRRNVISLHTIFTLQPRHDLFQWLFQTGRTFVDLQYRPTDELQLDFKLAPGAVPVDFVFAIVAKDELISVRDSRWDLTFTRTTEYTGLPPTLSVMSEFADVTEAILKQLGNFSLIDALSDPKILRHFRSLSITDQPRERPAAPIPAEKREKHLILCLSAPSPSQAADTVPFVGEVFKLIDNLSKLNVRPETKNKLRKTREELDKSLKEDSLKEKKEELEQAAEDKKAAKRRAEEERISKLSPAEQRKALEKERKRTMRKSQGKVVRK